MSADAFTPDAPPVDPAEALSQLSSLMRKYQKHHEHADMIHRSADMQRAEIKEFEIGESDKDEIAMVDLEAQMRILAEVVIRSDPKGRKSVQLPGGGEVCFRAGRDSIEVPDKEVLIGFVRGPLNPRIPVEVNLLRQPPTPRLEPDLNGIADGIRTGRIVVNDDCSLSLKGEDGERIPIPGVRLVKAEESFTVKPR